MKLATFLAVAVTTLAALVTRADDKISDLPASTSPSTNTIIELQDQALAAGTQSRRYLLTNLFMQGQASGIYIGPIAESYWGPSASDAVISFHGPSDDPINQLFIGTGDNTSQSTVTNIAYALIQGDRSGPRMVWKFLSDTNFQGSVPSSGFDGAASPANNEAWMRLVNNGTNLFGVTNNGNIFAFGDWRTNWPSGGGDTIWTNAAFSDSVGGTVQASFLSNTNGSNSIVSALNNVPAWGSPSSVITIGWTPQNTALYASNNFDIYAMGSQPFAGTDIQNASEFFVFGEFPMQGATINQAKSIVGIGYNVFNASTLTGNSSDLYAFGWAFDGASVNSGATIVALGDDNLDSAIIDRTFDVFAIGDGALSNCVLTNISQDVFAIGVGAGANLVGNGISHVFIAGSGGKATNSNDYVFGDAGYNYFFPGHRLGFSGGGGAQVASVESDGSITAGATNQWKLGSYQTNTVTLITTNYITVTIDGVDYKLAIVR